MRRLALAAITVSALATGGASFWALSQNPLAQPLIDRSTAEARIAIERAMAREVTADWLAPRLDSALATGDTDRVDMLANLAVSFSVPLDQDMQLAVRQALEPPGLATQAYDCAVCALDLQSCRSLPQMAACALPFEMTVAGDANALRRQAQAALTGEAIDTLETGLALTGIGATYAVSVSRGSSYFVKAGATLLRVARRMGALTPRFQSVLVDAANLPVNWSAVVRGAPLEDITDVTKLARLGRIAEDIGVVRANTSTAEAVVLLRYVDTADDAARLARLTGVTGRETRAVLEVLGPARTFRALTRVADAVWATIGLIAALAAQVGSLAASLALWLARRLLGAVAPR